MGCSAVIFSLFLMSPCGHGGSNGVDEAVTAAVSNPRRPAEDVSRDADRQPARVLSFFNIKPGMTVLDLFSGSGYYTEMLDSLVGPNGKVIAHSNDAYLSFSGDAWRKRHAGGRLAQTQTLVAEADDLEFAENSLDAAVLVLTWHDFLFEDAADGWRAIDEGLLLQKLCRALKPGAVLGLIDHVANAGGEPGRVARDLHRVDPAVVREAFSKSCFALEAEAGFLRNTTDDHGLSVFDKAIRGKTDRFVFRFVRS